MTDIALLAMNVPNGLNRPRWSIGHLHAICGATATCCHEGRAEFSPRPPSPDTEGSGVLAGRACAQAGSACPLRSRRAQGSLKGNSAPSVHQSRQGPPQCRSGLERGRNSRRSTRRCYRGLFARPPLRRGFACPAFAARGAGDDPGGAQVQMFAHLAGIRNGTETAGAKIGRVTRARPTKPKTSTSRSGDAKERCRDSGSCSRRIASSPVMLRSATRSLISATWPAGHRSGCSGRCRIPSGLRRGCLCKARRASLEPVSETQSVSTSASRAR
jgi:hypothetical protein